MGALMPSSMTAFSRLQKDTVYGQFCWEIRTVNHRFLELSFRLPETFRYLESKLRSAIRDKLHRGKVECQLKFSESSQNSEIQINQQLINTILSISQNVAERCHIPNDMTTSKLFASPGVISLAQPEMGDMSTLVEEVFSDAVGQLQKARINEGKCLQEHITVRLGKIKTIITEIRVQASLINAQIRNKLLERVRTLKIELEENRFEQEVAYLASRMDICEEVDRLEMHTHEVERIIEKNEPVGRRLDFLMQELNREANTLSSKSDSISLIQAAVDLKVLIEQMREQIQNIE
jgi:uncharacterized protein (TIGR00255 family)